MKLPLHTIGATMIGFICGGGLALANKSPAAPPPAAPMPAAAAAPGTGPEEGEPVTIRLENEFVKVFEVRLPPGGKVGQHSHPARVTFPQAPYTMKFSYPDGTSNVLVRKGGEVAWLDATTHSAENIGTTEFHVLGVEVKCAKPAKK